MKNGWCSDFNFRWGALIKTNLILSNPIFQHSIIPVPHGIGLY